MKKIFIFLFISLLTFCTLSAQITQEQADEIVIEYMNHQTNDFTLYAKDKVQSMFEITTYAGEILELDYPCWVYYVSSDEIKSKYLFVKESNGNLLEINTKNDEENLNTWRIVREAPCNCIMDTLKGEWNWYKTYGGFWGETLNNEFKSILKILSQNEDNSINYEVIVEDTLFYQSSFQILKTIGKRIETDIILPHDDCENGIWYIFLSNLSEKTLIFWDGVIDGYDYYYKAGAVKSVFLNQGNNTINTSTLEQQNNGKMDKK